MIARLWSARASADNAPAYAGHLREHVLPATREIDGYAGALLLERDAPDDVEILVVTLWDSLDAIRGFAGNDIERAVVADEAAALLTGFEDHVRHYRVAVRDGL